MLKTTILACFSMLFTITSFAQATFEVSEPYRVVDGPYKNYYMVGNDVYSLKIYRKNVTIQQFSPSDMKEVKRAELLMPERYLVEQIAKINGQYTLFYSTIDEENNTTHLISRAFDLKQMVWISEENQLLSTQNRLFDRHSPWGQTDPKRKFTFHYASDSSKILVKYRVFQDPDPFKNPDILGLHVFDINLNNVWGREYTMPYPQPEVDLFDFTVNTRGDAFIMAKVDNDSQERGKGASHRLEIFIFKALNSQILISRPEFHLPIVTSIEFIDHSNDHVTITGFYKRSKDASVESFFFWEMDSNGKVTHEEKFPISIKDLKMDEKKFSSKESRSPITFKEEDLDGLRLNQILPCDDGGQLLIFEKYFLSTSEYGNYSYNSHQLVAMRITENNLISWMRYLPKKQTSRWFVDPISYLHSSENQTHYFLYIDHLSNTEFKHTEESRLYTERGHGNLTAYVLNDQTGELRKEIILNTDNINKMHLAKVKASKIIPLANGQFLFEGYKGKKEDVMVKVNLGS